MKKLLITTALLSIALPGSAQTEPPTSLWLDADGDGLEDLYVFATGGNDALLQNEGDGTFAEVTERAGLAGLRSHRATVADIDGDGDADLLRVGADGGVRLHLGLGAGLFEDVTIAFGLARQRASAARFFDYDLDGRLDLELAGQVGGTRLLHNRDGLVFDEVQLGTITATEQAPVSPTSPNGDVAPGTTTAPASQAPVSSTDGSGGTTPAPGPRRAGSGLDRPTSPGRQPLTGSPASSGTPLGPMGAVLTCAATVVDAAGGCLQASSVPQYGMLHPLSQDLDVRADGNVTIGLPPNVPAVAKLHVDGGGWFQEGAFFNGGLGSAGVVSIGPEPLTQAYLGLDGNFGPFASDWAGYEIGVAGVSVGSSTGDNYGVLGRSNGTGVRGENDAFTQNWAELGSTQAGLVASGSPAARFLGSTDFGGHADFDSSAYFSGSTSFFSLATFFDAAFFRGGIDAVEGLFVSKEGWSGPAVDDIEICNDGDSTIRIEADWDNFGEFDHPEILLQQDGRVVEARITFEDGTNHFLIEQSYASGEMYFKIFDGTGSNDWEFQNFSDIEGRLTDTGDFQIDGSVSSPATDLAEYYPLAEPVEPGDVVAFFGEGLELVRALATAGETPRLAGIVSSKPGLILGISGTDESSTAAPAPALADDERFLGLEKELQVDRLVLHEIEQNARAPLALSGRLPCKVSAENGPIRAGDLLTMSSIPGHAARAVGAGPVIGTALQSHAAGTGKIVVLAGLGWYSPDAAPRLEALERELADLKRSLQAIARPR